MGSLSKLLTYSCYELGHTWHPNCYHACFEISLLTFIESCKIYGVVYLVSALIRGKRISPEYGKKLLSDFLRSACFLTTNGFLYIGFFCVIRNILQHVNVITASFLPAFFASLTAVMIERPERRSLLAIYVTNVASECVWNSLLSRGIVRSVPRGEVYIFMAAMAVLGYSFRSTNPLSPSLNSILQLFVGPGESGAVVANTAASQMSREPQVDTTRQTRQNSWISALTSVLWSRHSLCPHRGSCLLNTSWSAVRSFSQGFLLQLCIKLVTSLPRLGRSPGKVRSLLQNPINFKAGLGLAWFTAAFKGVCCLCRWIRGKDEASHGTLAGAVAGMAMYFYSAPSIALYLLWKTFEALYDDGCKSGKLPRIPGSVIIMYSISTAYLFHMAALEQYNLKPSYWRFLQRLTWGRMGEYNRYLLDEFGLGSSRNFDGVWPKYKEGFISESFKAKLASHIHAAS
ncbi:transmembrane protein 135-like isoform X1 [Oratosquilla oratoria]|uniref:transmembrane protein 135-like isoform X1 n=1 Tax=Oratosquilla oratoria TaxID=337810 RepID=UPI003F76D89B